MKCTACHTELESSGSFCGICGSKLSTDVRVSEIPQSNKKGPRSSKKENPSDRCDCGGSIGGAFAHFGYDLKKNACVYYVESVSNGNGGDQTGSRTAYSYDGKQLCQELRRTHEGYKQQSA